MRRRFDSSHAQQDMRIRHESLIAYSILPTQLSLYRDLRYGGRERYRSLSPRRQAPVVSLEDWPVVTVDAPSERAKITLALKLFRADDTLLDQKTVDSSRAADSISIKEARSTTMLCL